MPRVFTHSTAEQVVQVVDAVHVKGKTTVSYLENFCDLSAEQVTNATGLAQDLGLIKRSGDEWEAANILASFFSTPIEAQKAGALRIVLEKYHPFIKFRERLVATNSALTAAQQTKALLELDAHREDIKDTLISLGTYTGALSSQGGGRYTLSHEPLANELNELAAACTDLVSAEARVRLQIGARESAIDREEVMVPLSRALLKAKSNLSADAVMQAAIAFESFLVRLGERMGIDLTGANGIIQKLAKFRLGNHLPTKIVESGKYLGHIRNAADHGVDVDPEVGAVWHIQDSTGLIYVYVCCSLISACLEREANGDFII